MNNQNLPTWEEVPTKYALCFNGECKQCEECLHYLAAKALPRDKRSGIAIYPTAWAEGTCSEFHEAKQVQLAYGFHHLMSLVRQADVENLHTELYKAVGSISAYYRYNNGKYLLSPEKQEAVLSVFRSRGYTEDLHFDGYSAAWNFD